MTDRTVDVLIKVPAVTLTFWVIKILATMLGETGADTVSMSWLGEASPGGPSGGVSGYLIGSALFALLLSALLWFQIGTRRFNPWLYWATIIVSTATGTTLADFSTQSLGVGFFKGSLLLSVLVATSLVIWHRALFSVDIDRIDTARVETLYWITITLSQTLGTSFGDWIAKDLVGYANAVLIFGGALAVLAALYFLTPVSRILLFWSAIILMRPFGATLGDFFDKPIASGGLAIGRVSATAGLVGAICLCILLVRQTDRRPARGIILP